LRWDRVPSSFQDIFDYWVPLGCSDYHIKFFILSIILWGLWNIRNKGDREEIQSSNDGFRKIFSFMQKWRLLLKPGDAKYMDGKVQRMKEWLETFWKLTKDMEVEGVF
jgi:hypothetical protein